MLDVLNISFQSVVKAAPLDSVTSLSLEGSAAVAAMDLSFFSLFMQADVVVKGVMIMLILASIWSWAIIFDKWILFKSVKGKTNNFEKSFWSGQSLKIFLKE
jgi:biopolymer transport protein TolQ